MNCPKLHQNQDRAKGSSKLPLTPQLHQLLLCLLVTGYQNYNPMHSLNLRHISNNLFCQLLSISRKKKLKKLLCLQIDCIKWVISAMFKSNWTRWYQSRFFYYSIAFECRLWIALSLPQFLHYFSLDYPVNPCISIISF